MSTKTKTSELAIAERYKRYANYRLGETPALEAFTKMRDAPARSSLSSDLTDVVIGALTIVLALVMLGGRTLWIQSPSGETVRQFPLWQALRIVRRHGWTFASVEPIQPPRVISRREAIRILMLGDRTNGDKA